MMKNSSFVFILFFMCFIGIAYCSPPLEGFQQTKWKGTVDEVNGIAVIKNPKEPFYGEITFESTKAQKVHDVSGAGDTVISTLTVALVAGATMKEATTLANYAAGVVVSEVGAVPIYINDLINAVK